MFTGYFTKYFKRFSYQHYSAERGKEAHMIWACHTIVLFWFNIHLFVDIFFLPKSIHFKDVNVDKITKREGGKVIICRISL